jgi:hypothetical protein
MRSNWRRINDVIVQALEGVTLQELLPPVAGNARTTARRIDLRLAKA